MCGCVGRSRAAKPTRRDGSPQGLPFAHSAANLLFASEVIQMDGVPTSPAGVGMSETVTAHAVRVGEKSQQPDGVSVRSMDGPRGGSAARSALSPEIEKRGGSQKTQVNKAISGRPASSAGRSSENRSAFIPILPADISAGDGPDSAFRFLGSKTDPILHVSYPSPWNLVADFAAKRGENRENQNWRCLLTLVGTAILTSNPGTVQGDPGRAFRPAQGRNTPHISSLSHYLNIIRSSLCRCCLQETSK